MLTDLTRTYTIAFAMRSGSNEICSLLKRNGLGAPGEIFRTPLPLEPPSAQAKSFDAVVRQNQANGIFGSKMSHDHRAALDEYLRTSMPGYRQLDDVLPNHRWVWLTRRDKISQAISLCRAEQSNTWALTSPAGAAPDLFQYDFFELLSRMIMLQASDLIWELYFQRQGINPLCIIYEDFFRDAERQLKKLIEYLGGPLHGHDRVDTTAGYAIQRTSSDAAIYERFSSDLCRLGESNLSQQLGLPLETWNRFFFGHGWRQGRPE